MFDASMSIDENDLHTRALRPILQKEVMSMNSNTFSGTERVPGKHTPGPWATNGRYLEAGAVRLAILDDAEDNAGLTPEEAEANACLIASAPDLLAALESCLLALGRGGANVVGGPGRAEWEKARAAIAKAEGRT